MRARLLWRFDRFFTLPPDLAADPEIATHFRRNFLVNSADAVMWLFGASFVSANAILPVYASKLTGSPLVIGLIPALIDAGWFLPQLFLAPYVERLPRKLPIVAWLAAVERLPYLILAFAALWLHTLPHAWGVGIFLLLMVWRSFAAGFVAMPWQEMIATIIPVSHRGRFFGLSHLVGQLLGIAGAALASLILARFPFPRNFALAFFIGALGIFASYVFVLMTVEPRRAAITVHPHDNRAYLRRLRGILKANANFRTYLISRGLMYFGGMAYGFLAVYGVQRFGLSDAEAAIYTAIVFGSGVVGYAVWGPLGDRWGHKRVLELSGGLWLGALAVAMLARSPGTYQLAFALMGLSSAAGILGDLSITMEFGPEAQRPTYIGLARTVTGPVLFVAPLLAGVLVQWAGYRTMFGAAMAFSLVGLLSLWLRVVEPRRIRRDDVRSGTVEVAEP